MNVQAPLIAQSEPLRHDGERLSTSVVKILEGALSVIGSRGARRLSMIDISDASGVSRGTLYRYFPTKDHVLAAVSEFVSMNFETGIKDAADACFNPIERFRAVMRFFASFTLERTPAGIFEIEPAFHLDFFRSHFDRHKTAVKSALRQSFDYLDTVRSDTIDRDAVVEALVRMQLSTLIVPASNDWTNLWNSAPDTLERWILELAANSAQREEK
jgi:AcrR family transcriptional regulator